jgi:hypothetical protein
MQYWTEHGLPIMTLLQANHTIFSEESGEIALSVLATSQPTSNRTKLDQTRKDWQFVRTRFNVHADNPKKKHRILSKSPFSSDFVFAFMPCAIQK